MSLAGKLNLIFLVLLVRMNRLVISQFYFVAPSVTRQSRFSFNAE
jgi:hypothetical protein